jgi:general secretion pathway protein L
LHNRRAAADALEQRVAGDAARARAVAAQRQAYLDRVEGATFLQQARAARPTAVEVWDELSRRLPDGTYLEKVSLEGDRLMLVGFSSEASSLVARLEGSHLWRSPALTGVLQSDAASRRDRFTLNAELVGQGKPEAADAGNAK